VSGVQATRGRASLVGLLAVPGSSLLMRLEICATASALRILVKPGIRPDRRLSLIPALLDRRDFRFAVFLEQVIQSLAHEGLNGLAALDS
jgi:hypothetical protein